MQKHAYRPRMACMRAFLMFAVLKSLPAPMEKQPKLGTYATQMQRENAAICDSAFICGLLADGQGRRGSASAPFISLFSRFISAVSADIISVFVHFSFLRLMAITIFLLTVLLCVSTPAQLILHFREACRFYAPAMPQPFRMLRIPYTEHRYSRTKTPTASSLSLPVLI